MRLGILLLFTFLLTSCGQKTPSNSAKVPVASETEIGIVNLDIIANNESEAEIVSFGDMSSSATVTPKRFYIFNKTSANFVVGNLKNLIEAWDNNTSNPNSVSVTNDTCSNKTLRRLPNNPNACYFDVTIIFNVDLDNNTLVVPIRGTDTLTAPTMLLVVDIAESYLANEALLANANAFVKSTEVLSFGVLLPGTSATKRLYISNTSEVTSNPAPIAPTSLPPGVSIVKNTCTGTLTPRDVCLIDFKYDHQPTNLNSQVSFTSTQLTAPRKILNLIATSLQDNVVANAPKLDFFYENFPDTTVSGNSYIRRLTVTNLSSLLSYTFGANEVGSLFTDPSLTVLRNTCDGKTLAKDKSCIVDVRHIPVTDSQSVVINVDIPSAKVNEVISIGAPPVACTPANAGILNAATVSGNTPACTLVTCNPNYDKVGNACVAQACNIADFPNALTLTGNKAVGCLVDTCDLNYSVNSGATACEPTLCTPSDIANSATVTGNKITGCVVDTCLATYSKVGNTCVSSNVTRACTIQPNNSTQGTETSVDGGVTFGLCTGFVCDTNYTVSGQTCIPQACNVADFPGAAVVTGDKVAGCIVQSCTSPLKEVVANSCVDKAPDGSISFAQSYTKELTPNTINIVNPTNAQQIQFYSEAGCLTPVGTPISLPAISRDMTLTGPDGVKTAYAKFINGSASSACKTASITLDTLAPALVINEPVNNSTVTQNLVTVSGTCTELNAPTVTISISIGSVSSSVNCAGGNFSTSVNISSLTDGAQTLSLSATDLAGNTGVASVSVIKTFGCSAANATTAGVRTITGALTYSGNTGSGCFIESCNSAYSLNADKKSCDEKDIVGGSFLITKNTNGFINTPTVNLTSISATNAQSISVYESTNCSGNIKITDAAFTSSTAYTPTASVLNAASDQAVSIRFKNVSKTKCVHVAGAITLASANTFRHDSVAPVVTISGYTNNQIITANSAQFTGTCQNGISVLNGLSGQSLSSASCSGSYTSSAINTTTNGSYILYAEQTDIAGNKGSAQLTIIKSTACSSANAISGGVRSIDGALTYSGTVAGGCLIATCNTTFYTLAGDAKECVPRDITGGAFRITKNANGFINTPTVSLTSISATNAQTFDIFENTNCSAPAKVSSVAYSTSTSFTPSAAVLNAASDQPVSILFKNGSKSSPCIHVAGSLSTATTSIYRHDNIAPVVTITSPANNTTISTNSITMIGSCDSTITPFLTGIQGSELTATCATNAYNSPVSITTDGVYTIRSYQTDLAGNIGQSTITVTRNTTKTLTISKTGIGTVSSSPSVVNCGATCSANVTNGQLVVLTATPDPAYTFAGWSGGGCSGTGTCSVTMNANTTVSATFNAKPTFVVSVTKTSSTGTGLVSGNGVNCGATCSTNMYTGGSVTLTATPDANSTFVAWTGSCTGSQTTCTISNITAARTVNAQFNIKPTYILTVQKSGAGTGTITGGTINCGATCTQNLLSGDSITLTAAVGSGSSFGGWSGGGCSGTSLTCTVTMSAATTVIATFTPQVCASPSEVEVASLADPGGVAYMTQDSNDLYFVGSSSGITRISKTSYSVRNYTVSTSYSNWSGQDTDSSGQRAIIFNGLLHYYGPEGLRRINADHTVTTISTSAATQLRFLGIIGNNLVLAPQGSAYGLYYINSSSPNTVVLVPNTITTRLLSFKLLKIFKNKMYLSNLRNLSGPGFPSFSETRVLDSNMNLSIIFSMNEGYSFAHSLATVGNDYMILKAGPLYSVNSQGGASYSTGADPLYSYIINENITEIKESTGTYLNNGASNSLSGTFIKAPEIIRKIGNPTVIGNRIYGGEGSHPTSPSPSRMTYAKFCTGVYNLEYQTATAFTDSAPQCFTLYDATYPTSANFNADQYEFLAPSGFTEFNGKIYFNSMYKYTAASDTYLKRMYSYTPGGSAPIPLEATVSLSGVDFYNFRDSIKPFVVGDFLYFIKGFSSSYMTRVSKTNILTRMKYGTSDVNINHPLTNVGTPTPDRELSYSFNNFFVKYKNEVYFPGFFGQFLIDAAMFKIDINGNIVRVDQSSTYDAVEAPVVFDNNIFYLKKDYTTQNAKIYRLQCN